MPAHEQWRSHYGFVLATIGSAVGIGNIWRFSYVAGENGGATFLLLYLVCVALIGLPIVIAELTLGRRAQGDAIAAFEFSGDRSPWRFTGWLGAFGAFFILSYYAVIAGWALKYFSGAVMGALWTSASQGYGSYFDSFIANSAEPVVWQLVMLAVTGVVVARGVQNGIETFSRWVMPLLALIVVGLAAFSLSLPGAAAGVDFLFRPDWSVLSRPAVYVAALGQAFFSLGVGMSIFVTYGSYMPRAFSLPTSAGAIVVGDTLFAILAGVAIFPAVFAFGVDPAAGPELAFITLPQVFLQMPGGVIVGTVFFFLLAAAALTSMVSLLEVPVSVAIHQLQLNRVAATISIGTLIFVLGLPSALSFGLLSNIEIAGNGILDAIDAAVSSYLLPCGGILIALFVGWRMDRSVARREAELDGSRLGGLWIWLLRTVAPIAVLIVMLQSVSAL